MDKSKLTEANRLYNKINNLKSELKAVSRFETDTRVTVANQYDSYFHVEGETINRILAVAKESMERELEEYERLFSEL
jgi:hypothetical protein|nr:MAG TPA: hypothetical protein [Bacteriophage sp.]